jgi:glycosyltransferase involved in cell wall biosynthesis
MLLTIFTPTYNRADLLPKLYESICRQTGFTDFEWLIVDDGSTDATAQVVAPWLLNEQHPFGLRYVKQPNGGKHRAFNHGAQLAHGQWFLCIDSDDRLASDDALARVAPKLRALSEQEQFCSLTALRVTPSGDVIGTKDTPDDLDTDFFTYRNVMHIQGDRAEIFRTATLRQYPFPEFDGERFLSEGGMMMELSRSYLTRFSTLPLVICEYLPGGLTDNVDRLLKENPLGVMYNTRIFFSHPKAPLSLKLQKLYQHRRAMRRARALGKPIPETCRPTPAMRRLRWLLPFLSLAAALRRRLKN